MGLFGNLWNQVNPFDHGKTFSNPNPAPQPQQAPRPQVNIGQLMQSLQRAQSNTAPPQSVNRFFEPPQVQQPGFNPINMIKSVPQAFGINSGIDATRFLTSDISKNIADLTHNKIAAQHAQAAKDAAVNRLSGNVHNILPVAIAEGVKPFAQSVATAGLSGYADKLAKQEADRATRLLTPAYEKQAQAFGYPKGFGASLAEQEAGKIYQNFLQSELAKAGISPTDSGGQIFRKVGGQAVQAGTNILMAGELPGVGGSLAKTVPTFGGLSALQAIGGVAQQDNATLKDYLSQGAQAGLQGAALPIAFHGAAAGLKGISNAIDNIPGVYAAGHEPVPGEVPQVGKTNIQAELDKFYGKGGDQEFMSGLIKKYEPQLNGKNTVLDLMSPTEKTRYNEIIQPKASTPAPQVGKNVEVGGVPQVPKEVAARANHPGKVEMVPTSELAKFAEFNRGKSPLMSSEKYQSLKADIMKNGIQEPLQLNYGAKDRIASLGEGNHRLAVAQELGITHLPVEVTGTQLSKADQLAASKGFASVKGIEPDQFGYVPSNQKPSDIGIKTAQSAPQVGKTPNLNEGAFSKADQAYLERTSNKQQAEIASLKEPVKLNTVQNNPISKIQQVVSKELPDAKPAFMDATNKYLGEKTSSATNNVAVVRQLPKVDSTQSLDLIDAIQGGSASGDFSKVPGDIRTILDSTYSKLKNAGIDVGYLEDYFPQQWKNGTPQEVNNAYQILNQKAGFQNPRTIPTIKEGVSLGYAPKFTDYRLALNEYLNSADKLIANKRYFDQLKSTGLIVEAPSSRAALGLEPVTAPGVPAPSPYSDPVTGVQSQGLYYAKPSVARELNKLFSPDIKSNFGKVAEKTGNTSSAMQTLFLSGGIPGTPINAFGAAQWTKQVLSGRPIGATKALLKGFSEKATQNYEVKNIDLIRKMETAGVPYRGTLDVKSLSSVSDRIAEQHGVGKAKTAILEGWNKAVEDPTFRRMMPIMQLDTFKSSYERLIKQGIPEETAVAQAADATRHSFGLNTLAKDALKNQTAKDVTKTLFFAPKFRESMVNFWSDNIKSLGNINNPAYRENIKFLANATMLFGAMQAANMAFNEGNTTFQNANPNDKLSLSIPRGDGKSISLPFLSSIATVPRTIVSAGIDLASGNPKEAGLEGKKLLSQLIRPGVDLAFNQKYNGKKVYNPTDSTGTKLKDQALYLAGQYNHPYVQAGINAATGKSSGALETAATATELPIRFRNYDASKAYGAPVSGSSKAPESGAMTMSEYNKMKANPPAGYTLQQREDGKYIYNLDGEIKTTGNYKTAQRDIAKDTFSKSDAPQKVIGNMVYRKNADGSVAAPITVTKYNYDLGTSTLVDRKNAGDLNGWMKTAQSQIESIKTQLQDPNIDAKDKLDLNNQATAIIKDAAKYQSYGGFTKGRSGNGARIALAGIPKVPTVKTRSVPKIKVAKTKTTKFASVKFAKPRRIKVK